MTFQWQKLEDAALTLEIDPATLRQWIDQGRAPTRNTNGTTEVLIEFPDPADETAADAEPVDPTVIDADFTEHHHPLQTVTRRELQLAGTVAAAWQRMAEQAECEVARSRRIGAIGWIILVLITIAAGVGLYFINDAMNQARTDASLAHQKLETTESVRDDLSKQNADLFARDQKLIAELTDAKTNLAAATQQAEQLHNQLSDQSKQHDKLAAALQKSIDQQTRRIEDLRKQLSAANKQLQQSQTRITALQKKLDETAIKPDEAKP